MVFYEGDFRVSQYGQWDGYPSGNGLKVLRFLRDEFNQATFLENLAKCRQPTQKQIERMYVKLGAKPGNLEWISMDIADKFKAAHPTLSRDCGAGVLSAIQNAPTGVDLRLDRNFAADSLFCEWAYLIDLDAGVFEVYKGYNKKPLAPGERFADLSVADDAEFRQIKRAAVWPLRGLPSEEAFLAALAEPAEAEEYEVE
jgi:hypothetical protein